MPQGTYRGTYETGDPRAAAQAKAMGATIGSDGWWYKGGKKLSHDEADALAKSTGTAADNAHQQWGTGDIWDRNRNFVGNALKNVAPIAGILTGGVGGVLLGGLGAAAGAGVRHGTNIGNIAKTGIDNAMLTSSGQGLASSMFGYNGPMSAVSQAAAKASTNGAAALTPSSARLLGGSTATPGVLSLENMATRAAPDVLRSVSTSTPSGPMGTFDWLTPKNIETAAGIFGKGYDAYNSNQQNQTQNDYYNRRLAAETEAEKRRNELNAEIQRGQEARANRQQELSEEDRKRLLMIMQNRDAEMSPVREQLMKAIMGSGDSTLFGGSIMKGLGSAGHI